jgi:hypothetical protein
MESYFCIPQFFLASFRPSRKLPRHTCGSFASYQCAAANRLNIAELRLHLGTYLIYSARILGAVERANANV